MEKERYDFVVMGVGAMGSATLCELSKRGFSACGIERFGIAHDRGSSHGKTRMIRKAYFEHPAYIPLLNRSYELWQNISTESGQVLFVNNGLILAAKPDSRTIAGLQACYSQHDLPHERMRGLDAMQRFPQFHVPRDLDVFYDPLAGFLYVEKCIEVLVKRARQVGAKLYTHEPVVSWQLENDGVRVTTSNRVIKAKKLIMTTGAWITEELARFGIEFDIWRKVLFWYASANLAPYHPDRFPNFYVESNSGHFYGFPAINRLGIKLGEHNTPQSIPNPDTIDRDLNPDDEAPVQQFLQEVFPDFRARLKKFTVCMYTKTNDDHFILDFLPGHDQVIVGCGFSGHGFKFAPVIGEILSDLAIAGQTSHPIDFLRIGRFLPE